MITIATTLIHVMIITDTCDALQIQMQLQIKLKDTMKVTNFTVRKIYFTLREILGTRNTRTSNYRII